jgi:hypothetical protein
MTNKTEVEINEAIVGREMFRLMDLCRNPKIDDLLDAAFDGRAKTVESVTKLYTFILQKFGEGISTAGSVGSSTTDKFWSACSEFLRESGMTDEELRKIRSYPRAGELGFRSILDEMHDEGV